MISFNQYCKTIRLYPATQLEYRIVLAAFLSLAVFFGYYPKTDLMVAELLYGKDGWTFNNYWTVLITDSISRLVAILITVLIGILFTSWSSRYRHKIHFLLLAFLIGPGLLINAGFKEHWGRARPGDIVQFGGEKQYTAPLQPAEECKRNCSFVSGHASVGYSLILLGALTGNRLFWLMGGTVAGLAIGLLRMIQSGHFLSDVLFAFFPVWIAMELVIFLYWFIHVLKINTVQKPNA